MIKDLDILSRLSKYGLESIGRYYSKYRGIVISPLDPKGVGRVEVLIPSILHGVKVWASPMGQGGSAERGFRFMPPSIGEIVYVEFEKGNLSKPLYTYHGWTEDTIPLELMGNRRAGIVTTRGHKILIDDGEDYIKIEVVDKFHPETSTSLELKLNGEILINGGGSQGILKVTQLKGMVEAILKDLLVAQSGTNLSKWLAGEDVKPETGE